MKLDFNYRITEKLEIKGAILALAQDMFGKEAKEVSKKSRKKRSLNGALGSWLSMEMLLERCANASMSSLLGDPQWCAGFQAIRIFF
ncbi:hypothetical protein [Helicobacter pylori]|uniref:hypothetical protein n=1 Tax=Helicobacter pylori TaxID=210 RepID=UPI0018E27F3D|nr:hypothetical protein [Helicobacter pylori]